MRNKIREIVSGYQEWNENQFDIFWGYEEEEVIDEEEEEEDDDPEVEPKKRTLLEVWNIRREPDLLDELVPQGIRNKRKQGEKLVKTHKIKKQKGINGARRGYVTDRLVRDLERNGVPMKKMKECILKMMIAFFEKIRENYMSFWERHFDKLRDMGAKKEIIGKQYHGSTIT